MPAKMNAQKKQHLRDFVGDFISLQEQKFDPACKEDQRTGYFIHEGKEYLSFFKLNLSNKIDEYYIARLEKDLSDQPICKTKKGQERVFREWMWIYPLRQMTMTNDGTIIGDWYISGYSRSKGWRKVQ
jgi:hypothetical protein